LLYCNFKIVLSGFVDKLYITLLSKYTIMIKLPKVFSFEEMELSEDFFSESEEVFMNVPMRRSDEKTLFIAS